MSETTRPMRLPATHGATASVEFWSGGGQAGYRVAWYADDDGGSGYGDKPLIQYWYGDQAECLRRAAGRAPRRGWFVPAWVQEGGAR